MVIFDHARKLIYLPATLLPHWKHSIMVSQLVILQRDNDFKSNSKTKLAITFTENQSLFRTWWRDLEENGYNFFDSGILHWTRGPHSCTFVMLPSRMYMWQSQGEIELFLIRLIKQLYFQHTSLSQFQTLDTCSKVNEVSLWTSSSSVRTVCLSVVFVPDTLSKGRYVMQLTEHFLR